MQRTMVLEDPLAACNTILALFLTRRSIDAPVKVSFSPMTHRLMPNRIMAPVHMVQGESVLRIAKSARRESRGRLSGCHTHVYML